MTSYREILTQAKLIKKSDRQLQHVSIAIGSNANLDFINPSLQVGLDKDGFACTLHNIDYDSWQHYAISKDVPSYDFWIIWMSSYALSAGEAKVPITNIESIVATVKHITQLGSNVIFVLPELLSTEIDPFDPISEARTLLTQTLTKELSSIATLVDPSFLQSKIGHHQWVPENYWEVAKMPCHPNAITALGLHLSKIISKSLRPTVKAIAVDLDNTLWGGVVGDDGVENLKLDVFGSGQPFIQMQTFLKNLSNRGIPLCVVSKNEESNALAPFSMRTEMVLKKEDFIYFMASWDNKFKAVQRIAENLNIGLDSICFIDDSIHERSEMRKFLPTVIVPELAENPSMRCSQLRESGLFFIPQKSNETLRRTEMYKEEQIRKSSLSQVTNMDEYLKGLELKMTCFPISDLNLPRVTDLINKTNQFHLTTKRYTNLEVKKFISDANNYAFCFSVSDKFGDLGIVSVLMAKQEKERFEIDTWLLSCRAFNLGIEYAVAKHLADWLQIRSINKIYATYLATAKNGVVKDFYSKIGLSLVKDTSAAKEYSGAIVAPPFHIIVTSH